MSESGIRPLVTDTDDVRLRSLTTTPVGRRHDAMMRLLLDKLNRCRIVPAARMPASIVTMNSRIVGWEDGGIGHELALVYPWDASPASERVSVLSPLGIDLLGAVPGHAFRIDGARFKIAYVAYQPEAERQFHL